MVPIPPPLNNPTLPFNFPPAALSLPTNTASPILPFTIDPVAYISDVYDSLFASQVAEAKNFRGIHIKKLLLDHAAQELIFHSILTFDDLIAFTLDILHRTALLP